MFVGHAMSGEPPTFMVHVLSGGAPSIVVHMLYGGGGGEANVVGWVVGFGVRLEKILLRMVMAHHYASPGCWKGALGCGF